VGDKDGIDKWEKCLAKDKKLKYDYSDCKVKNELTAGSSDDDLYQCYKDNGLNINETICNDNNPY